MLIGLLARQRDGLRQARLADAAGAGDRDQPVMLEQVHQRRDIIVAAKEPTRQTRNIGPHGRRLHLGRNVSGGLARELRRRDMREAVTAPGNGRDRLGADDLAQRGDLHRQVAFLDHKVGPDDVEQFVLGHQAPRTLGQCDQQIEGLGSHRGRPAIDQQPALDRNQLEAPEGKAGKGQLGGGAHGSSPLSIRLFAAGEFCSGELREEIATIVGAATAIRRAAFCRSRCDQIRATFRTNL